MQTPWIFSSTFLPCAGEPIDFVLEDRSQPIYGTFVNGLFHSRWADYGADRVQSWRGSGGGPVAPLLSDVDPPVAFGTTWKRLTGVFFAGRKVTRSMPPSRHVFRARSPQPETVVRSRTTWR